MTIEDEIAKILQEEIDKEVLIEIRTAHYISLGWTLITIDAAIEDIGDWMKHIQGDWRAYHDRWLFENADDATLFKLTWG